MTYAAAVLIVENILRNATVLQGERERIDEALRVLKGQTVQVSAEDISKGAQEAIQRHKDRIFAPSQQPVDDPNWPPAPEQKGPDGPM